MHKKGDNVVLSEQIDDRIVMRVEEVASVTGDEIRVRGRPFIFDHNGKERGKPQSTTQLLPATNLFPAISKSQFIRDPSRIAEIRVSNARAREALEK